MYLLTMFLVKKMKHRHIGFTAVFLLENFYIVVYAVDTNFSVTFTLNIICNVLIYNRHFDTMYEGMLKDTSVPCMKGMRYGKGLVM